MKNLKIVKIPLFTTLILPFLFFCSKTCDDCMHFPIKLTIRDKSSGSIVNNVNKIIVTHNNKTDTLFPSLDNSLLFDSVYCIGSGKGKYTLTVFQSGYDTFQINNILVEENECNVITKVITVRMNKTGTILNKTNDSEDIKIEESEDCG